MQLEWIRIIPSPGGLRLYRKVSSRTDKLRYVLSQYHDGGTPVSYYMIRQEDWKYVYYAGGYRPQLFNLAEEPFGALELNDLGGNLAKQLRWQGSSFGDDVFQSHTCSNDWQLALFVLDIVSLYHHIEILSTSTMRHSG